MHSLLPRPNTASLQRCEKLAVQVLEDKACFNHRCPPARIAFPRKLLIVRDATPAVLTPAMPVRLAATARFVFPRERQNRSVHAILPVPEIVASRSYFMPHSSPLKYQSGFANEFATEAHPGALPIGQNSPQKHPLGLYTEQVSGSAFSAPRGLNRRSWMYRIRPSVVHEPYQPFPEATLLRSGPFNEEPTPPNQMRWDPLPFPN